MYHPPPPPGWICWFRRTMGEGNWRAAEVWGEADWDETDRDIREIGRRRETLTWTHI